MGRVLPILFNTGMVRAILDGRKTATRRAIRYKHSNTEMKMRTDKYGTGLIEIQKNIEGETFGRNPDGSSWQKLLPYIEKRPPYKAGDTLYVRETWNFVYEMDDFDQPIYETGGYVYYADDPMTFSHWVDTDTGDHKDRMPWRPSIHMPKEAARIWLKVTGVRLERLNDMTLDDFLKEGVVIRPEAFNDPDNAYWQAKDIFTGIWDSTIRKPELKRYGWEANPWVWEIEFERCEKPKQR